MNRKVGISTINFVMGNDSLNIVYSTKQNYQINNKEFGELHPRSVSFVFPICLMLSFLSSFLVSLFIRMVHSFFKHQIPPSPSTKIVVSKWEELKLEEFLEKLPNICIS